MYLQCMGHIIYSYFKGITIMLRSPYICYFGGQHFSLTKICHKYMYFHYLTSGKLKFSHYQRWQQDEKLEILVFFFKVFTLVNRVYRFYVDHRIGSMYHCLFVFVHFTPCRFGTEDRYTCGIILFFQCI